MFKAMNYVGGSFSSRFGIYDDSRESNNLHAWVAAEDRDRVLRRLRDGEVDWRGATALADDRGYTLSGPRSEGGNWEGRWTEVHEPSIDDPTAPDASPVPEPVTREQHDAVVAELNATIERLTAENARLGSPITDTKDARLTAIWERAAEVAENEGFCPEYERLANGLGIPGRSRLYRGIVTVRFNVYSYATDTSDDSAARTMEENVRERLRDTLTTGGYGEGDISHLDFEGVEAEDVSVY